MIIHNVNRIRHEHMFECYILSSPQINFYCEERKGRKRTANMSKEESKYKGKERECYISEAYPLFYWKEERGKERKR